MKRFFFLALTALAVLVNAQAREWKLEDQNASFTAADGDVIFGSILPGKSIVVSIADNAKVTLRNAHITYNNNGSGDPTPSSPSLKCLGNAEITIVGKYNMILNSKNYSAIYVPQGKTLKINGTDADSLYVMGGPKAAGIGAYNDVDAGSIQILGGKIEAHGGSNGAGIGGAFLANCGTIDIYGGKVKAYGGDRAAGIGSGFDSSKAAYVNITKPAGGATTTVYAEGGFRAAGIGCGCMGECGVINISKNTNVTAVKGKESVNSIGIGYGCKANWCGTITIGGTTYANGVERSYFNYPDIHTIDLSKMTSDFTMEEGDILTGTLGEDRISIKIADGAHVTLRDAKIPELLGKGSSCGLYCKGNADITLTGTNEVWHRGGAYYPAIFVPENKTLSIRGTGKLSAHGGGYSAGIGTGASIAYKESFAGIELNNTEDIISCLNRDGGNITIYGGTIEAYGGVCGPGIGAARHSHCGMIQIIGGKVSAYGGSEAPGIGAAGWTGLDYPTVCGDIRLSGGTIYARGKGHAPAIGSEKSYRNAESGNIWIMNTVNKVTAIKGDVANKCLWSTEGTLYINGQAYTDGINLHAYYYPEDKVIDLASQQNNLTVPDGYTLTGNLPSGVIIEIEDGAEVILDGVGIDNDGGSASAPAANRAPAAGVNMNRSGLMLKGNAVLRLKGETTIRSKGDGCPGIYIPANKVLEIKGDGILNVYGGRNAAGIGGGEDVDAGHIMILGEASVNAYGGHQGAGIGGGYLSNCGEIVIWTDGTVNAKGGKDATGIGSGYDSSRADKIIIKGGSVNAEGSDRSPAIGAACRGTCGMIYLYSTIRSLKAVKGPESDHSIGKGRGAASQHGGIAMDDQFFSNGIDLSPYYYPNNVIDLATVTSDFTAYNGSILTGKLNGLHQIFIEDGATVTLRNAEIKRYAQATDTYWPGITCKGKAIIKLEGTNTVTGMDRRNPAIFVPENKTLFIQGPGTLYAHAQGAPASIGAGVSKPCGNIEIQGGRIEAYNLEPETSYYGAGIGGTTNGWCGNIIITGGTVIARGNSEAPGIGTGADGFPSTNKKIYILGGITYAYGGKNAPAIGAGWGSQISGVVITDDVEFLRAEAGEGAIYSIGKSILRPDKTTKCGPIQIEDEVYEGITEEVFYYPSEAVAARYRDPKTIKLDSLGNWNKLILVHGDRITGTLPKAMFVSIVKGATVTFDNVTINGVNDTKYGYAAITCEGDANIKLVGTNKVTGNDSQYPAFFVPENSTLQFSGVGKLTAKSKGGAPAIGGKLDTNCGNIVLANGTYDLEGGSYCPAIGSQYGNGCGKITIEEGVTLTAKKGASAPNTIGAAKNGTCGTVTIGYRTGAITESPYYYPAQQTYDPYYLDLSTLTNDRPEVYVQTEGTVITGTLPAGVKVKIIIQNRSIDGVTLRNVTINGTNSSDAKFAGLTFTSGTNKVILEGTNTIRGFHEDYPGIYVDANSSVIFRGNGTLNVSSNGKAPAMGGTKEYDSGDFAFCDDVKIYATGGTNCPAIGAAAGKKVYGAIDIWGGTIHATGGSGAPAIGAGPGGHSGSIRIYGATELKATKGSGATYCLGGDVDAEAGVKFGSVQSGPSFNYIHGFCKNNTFTYSDGNDIIDAEVEDGTLLMGTFTRWRLKLAKDAKVTLMQFKFMPESEDCYIQCNGNNEFTFDSKNEIKQIGTNWPAILTPYSGTTTFKASTSNALGGHRLIITSAQTTGIGPASSATAGKIVFDGGIYDIQGGDNCPAIGSCGILNGGLNAMGEAVFKNGTFTLRGGKNAPAVGACGSGQFGNSKFGSVKLYNTLTSFTATAGEGCSYSIGASEGAECGTISLYNDGESAAPEVYENGIEESPFIYPRSAGLSVRTLRNQESIEGEVPYRVRIAPNAVVWFNNVSIGGQAEYDYNEPGVYCEGDAGIILTGHSTVQSFNPSYPGIYVPEGSTLILYALVGSTDAALDASSKGNVVRLNTLKKVNGRYVAADDSNPKMAAGIGGYVDAVTGKPKNCGNILINGANITATGGAGHPGIGGGTLGNCGTITINGGSVLAIGGPGAPGIGAGTSGSCGAIRLTNQVTRVEARAGEGAPNSVGFAETDAELGMESSCASIIVGKENYGDGITDAIFIYEPTDEERKEDIELVYSNGEIYNGKTYKVMINGQLLLINGEQIYTITGQRVH